MLLTAVPRGTLKLSSPILKDACPTPTPLRSSFSISPLTSNRFLRKTDVVTALAASVLIFSRQYVLPVAGSSEYTPSCAQTTSWRLPPAVTTTGELFVRPPVGAFHTSWPEFLSRASTDDAYVPG